MRICAFPMVSLSRERTKDVETKGAKDSKLYTVTFARKRECVGWIKRGCTLWETPSNGLSVV